MGLVTSLKAKLDIYRLEQRYTKRRNRRTGFVSGARYIEGEYVYDLDNDDFTDRSAGSSPQKNHLAGLREAGMPGTTAGRRRTISISTPARYRNYRNSRMLDRSASSPLAPTNSPFFPDSSPASIPTASEHPSPPSATLPKINRNDTGRSDDDDHIENFGLGRSVLEPSMPTPPADAWGVLPERPPRRGGIRRGMSWMG